jgi:transcriptional regulator with XRE-family HTH domain
MVIKIPNPIDRHVGSRVRMRRMMLGISQEKLGEALGVTFQQIQKYEKGTNRVSASRLQHTARILDVPVSFFFDGAPSDGNAVPAFADGGPSAYLPDLLSTPDGMQLGKAFMRIKSPKVRRKIVDLVETLADDDSEKS